MREACGVFGINCVGSCYDKLAKGIFNLQHRGQEHGGFSLLVGDQIQNVVKSGLIKPTFIKERQERPELLESQMGIAHVSLLDPQPIRVERSKAGPFTFAINGRIVNREECLQRLGNPALQIGSDAEILAMLVAKGRDYLQGIKNAFRYAKGAFSFVMLTPDGIFAGRDPLGFKPLLLGKSLDGCACSSESVALDKIQMRLIREVKPGEVVFIEKEGFKPVYKRRSERRALCPFEFSYFARISSIIEGIPVVSVRHNTGAALFQDDEVDLVSPIPFSGMGHAEGYHRAAIAVGALAPYTSMFEYNRYTDRSWTPPSQDVSDVIAEDKLSIIEAVLKGKAAALVDDSIFGATQVAEWIYRLLDWGLREAHCRIAVPPVKSACLFDFPNRIGKRLIAADHTEEEIRKMIGAKTLRFNTLEAFLGAVLLAQKEIMEQEDPRIEIKNPLRVEDFCTYCFTGINPLEQE